MGGPFWEGTVVCVCVKVWWGVYSDAVCVQVEVFGAGVGVRTWVDLGADGRVAVYAHTSGLARGGGVCVRCVSV